MSLPCTLLPLFALLPGPALAAAATADDPWLQRLEPSDPALATSFGEVLAFASGRLAVGAPDAFGSGAVVLFRQDPGGWTEEAVLRPPQPTPGARFGASLCVHGALLLVGAPHASAGGLTEQGEVVAFEGITGGAWGHAWTLRSPAPVPGGHFGAAIARNVWLWVGEPGNGDGVARGYTGGTTAAVPPVLDQSLGA